MKKKEHSIFNIGTSSILLVFVILCLVTFSMLAIVNAKMDFQLSESSARHTADYYKADEKAKQILSEIDELLYNQYQMPEIKDIQTLYNNVQNKLSISSLYNIHFDRTEHTLTYSVPVDKKQVLMVTLTIIYPNEPGNGFYHIDTWSITTGFDWQADDTFRLYDGSTTQ